MDHLLSLDLLFQHNSSGRAVSVSKNFEESSRPVTSHLMHDSSYEKMDAFVRVHLAPYRDQPLEILDFGAQVVGDQGLSYKGLFDADRWHYRGLDIAAGINVDIQVDNAYDWTEVPSDSVDLVISGQAFEHVEYFWASMFEIVRAIKPGGLAVIIAPSGGFEHRYPLDCWRFYRDGFVALAKYVGCDLIDAFTDWGNYDWEDSILVVRKPVSDQAGRDEFDRRSVLQRALLADVLPTIDELTTQWQSTASQAEASVLASVTLGALTTELEAQRGVRMGKEAEVAVANEAALNAASDAANELEVLRSHVEALKNQPTGPMRYVHQGRAKVAGVVGPKGRAIYKKLRRRG
jgi:SAM-dependent methyltransferase